jgi:tetratricopeptide (TPR) repeat protein
VIARYGTSDLLPDDPEKLTERDFVRAADAFETALSIFSIPPLTDVEKRVLGPYRASVDARYLFARGRAAAFHRDQLQKARDLLEKAAGAVGLPIPEISNALGITYLEYPAADPSVRRQELLTAIRYFRQSSALAPTWPYPLHNLALAYIQLGDSATAEQIYRGAAAISRLPYIYYNLGLVEHRSNQLKEARSAYQEALHRAEATESELRQRARDWKTVLPNAASLAMHRAEVFHRNRAEMQNALGSLMEHERHWDEAADWYGRALSSDPKLCPARYNLAALEILRGPKLKSPAAATPPKDLLTENTRSCPDFLPSWSKLGDLLAGEHDWSDSRGAYEKALTGSSRDADTLFSIGKTYEAENRPAQAYGYFKRAVTEYERQPGGSTPLAPPQAYLAVIRVRQPSDQPCDWYRKAEEAQHLIPGVTKAQRKEMQSGLAACRVQKP